MNGVDIRKHIITLLIGIIITSVYNKYNDISKNNDSILVSNEKLEQFDKRITKLEDDNRKLGDVYVTRREFTVIVDNLNNTLKRVDDNILKLTEKFYDNQGKK
ncbi:hypothetical protein [Fusobacterium sp.]|uniref:hypothetical protein n=1 Tax=Fusobacterium sp. TaxID=68766 RepID=UPI0025B8E0D4|nr:hypothetical protein [Fusobacterium sp.]